MFCPGTSFDVHPDADVPIEQNDESFQILVILQFCHVPCFTAQPVCVPVQFFFIDSACRHASAREVRILSEGGRCGSFAEFLLRHTEGFCRQIHQHLQLPAPQMLRHTIFKSTEQSPADALFQLYISSMISLKCSSIFLRLTFRFGVSSPLWMLSGRSMTLNFFTCSG